MLLFHPCACSLAGPLLSGGEVTLKLCHRDKLRNLAESANVGFLRSVSCKSFLEQKTFLEKKNCISTVVVLIMGIFVIFSELRAITKAQKRVGINPLHM